MLVMQSLSIPDGMCEKMKFTSGKGNIMQMAEKCFKFGCAYEDKKYSTGVKLLNKHK